MRFCLSSRRRHTSWPRDWSSDVCSSDLLVELHRERIRHARVVGNPGCYPVTVLLGLAPLLQQDTPLIDTSNIIADCKSGRSEERRVGKAWKAGERTHDERQGRKNWADR